MAVDIKKVQEHIRGILTAIGEDPDREGLKDTPLRVAHMYEEIFEGIGYSNDEIAEMFNKTFEDDLIIPEDNREIVLVKDMDIFSYCEHHLALMYNMKAAIAYIPVGKVLGLSKIARIADMVGKRLQLQERIAFGYSRNNAQNNRFGGYCRHYRGKACLYDHTRYKKYRIINSNYDFTRKI